MAKHFIISTVNDLIRIQPEKIVYISSDGNYSTIYLCDGESRVVTIQLGKLEEMIGDQLGNEGSFLARIGRSLIINSSYVYYINITQQKLILSDQKAVNYTLTASKEALKALKEHFEKEITE
ncbi:MAG: LytTR family transcriptional regulator DNA-binding domain-containing protein [Bacteroidales bacterium]|nr:LytTR family transcriptional regulator DNA-binding domain-containing protein [Bacteroidales bacterium]